MWNHLRSPLLALSLGLNLAFAAIWLAHAAPDWAAGQTLTKTVADPLAVPSALHREIGVTPEQWQRIEPIIRDFREKAAQHRQTISSLRGQLVDLLRMPVVDEAAVRSKQEEILTGQRRMQDLVIGHLLKEKAMLAPDQAEKLIQSLCEQCRHAGGMVTGKGLGGVLDGHSDDGAVGKEKMQ